MSVPGAHASRAPESALMAPAAPTRAQVGDGSWLMLPPPYARRAHSAVLDPVRGRMIVFGGDDADGLDRIDTWALTLLGTEAWQLIAAAGAAPPARRGHCAIYDPVRHRMIIFGGYDGTSYRSDVWALSLSGTPSWTELVPNGTPPAPRTGHSAVYDPFRDRMVVFGGYDGSTSLADVWVLTFSGSVTWTQLSPSGGEPSARYSHAAVFDEAHDRMIVFAGASDGLRLSDVWALDLSGSTAWSSLAPAGTAPSARFAPAAAYDSTSGRMIVFGGYDGAGRGDVWALDLGASPAWSELAPTGAAPSERWLHSAIFDAARNRMVAFGGQDASPRDYLGDVWALTLSATPAWSELALPGAPQRRQQHTAILDPVGDRLLVFGGYDGFTPPYAFNDIWALPASGASVWEALSPSGTPPSPRFGHTAIYDDPIRDRMLVFGGSDLNSPYNDVWQLTLTGTPTWSPVTTAGTPPAPRFGHSAIYDPVRDRMLVFGGYPSPTPTSTPMADLWSLSLSGTPTWTEVSVASPLTFGIAEHAAIHDPVRDQMILFGGMAGSPVNGPIDFALAIDLSGTPQYTAIGEGKPPASRMRPQAVYDPVRDVMIVFGGGQFVAGGSFFGLNDTWALHLSGNPQWTQLFPTGELPNGVGGHTATYDPRRHRMLVFGGVEGTLVHHDTWALALGTTIVPVPVDRPSSLRLGPPHPNPSAGTVTIEFELAKSARAALDVFDVRGRRVCRLADGPLPPGQHARTWSGRDGAGRDAGAGVFFVCLDADGVRRVSRLVRFSAP